MQTFEFPAGAVHIDEGKVWDGLTEWLESGKARHVFPSKMHSWYFCRLVDDDEMRYVGKSQLSMADATAQALQIYISR